jgi:hypothetical protein
VRNKRKASADTGIVDNHAVECSHVSTGAVTIMTQVVRERRMAFPAVEAERHFIQVGGEMLWPNSAPCSNDAALEQRESRFDILSS